MMIPLLAQKINYNWMANQKSAEPAGYRHLFPSFYHGLYNSGALIIRLALVVYNLNVTFLNMKVFLYL
jgi:hypothetical protein